MKTRTLIITSIVLLIACLPGAAPIVTSPTFFLAAVDTATPQITSPAVVTDATAAQPIATPSTGWFELVGHSSLLEQGYEGQHALSGLGHDSTRVARWRCFGEFIGVHSTLLVGALGGLLAVLWVFFSPVRSLIQTPSIEEEPSL